MKTIQTILDEFDKEFFIVPDNVPKKEKKKKSKKKRKKKKKKKTPHFY